MNDALHGTLLDLITLTGTQTYGENAVRHTVVLEEYARTLVVRSTSTSRDACLGIVKKIQDRFTWEVEHALRMSDDRSHQTISYVRDGTPEGLSVIVARSGTSRDYAATVQDHLPFLAMAGK